MITNRNITLDIMKGIGALIIVWDHSFVGNVFIIPAVLNNGFENMIMSFVIAAFFVVSGYLAFGKMLKTKSLIDKIKRFVIPCFIWMLLITPVYYIKVERFTIQHCFAYWFNIATEGFQGGLWFLWCLMLCFVIIFIIENITIQSKNKKVMIGIISIITIVILQLIEIHPSSILGLNDLSYFGIFFLIGYNIKVWEENLIKIKNLMFIGLIVFPVVGYLTNWMLNWETTYGFRGLTLFTADIINKKIWDGLETFTIALLGTMFLWSISKILSKIIYLKNIFIYLGIASIAIYIINGWFTFAFHINNTWIACIIWTVISVSIYELLKRNIITRKFIGLV